MSDFRVDTFFFRHNKTKRLHRLLGYEGVFALMRLWAYASDCKYDGDHVYTADDIELAVDWSEKPGALVAALASVEPYIRFIDAVDGGYVIHDWQEHNCYAATANSRTDAARNAANIRWKKKHGIKDDADLKNEKMASEAHNCGHMQQECAAHTMHDASAHAPLNANHAHGNAPSPSPSPSPSNERLKTLCERSPSESAPAGAGHAKTKPKGFCQEQFALFWEAFADKRGKTPAWDAWKRVKGLDQSLAETIIAGAKRYAIQRPAIVARNGTPKMAQGWLTDRRWEDEGEVVTASATPLSKDLDAAFSRAMEASDGCV